MFSSVKILFFALVTQYSVKTYKTTKAAVPI